MPYKEPKIEKVFYRTGEVAAMFGVKPSNIRFWEKEFNTLRPKKNGKGDRLFTTEDIEQFRLIYHLVRERGMTLKGAREVLRRNPSDTSRDVEIIRRLRNIRNQLLEIRDQMDRS